MRMVDLLNRIIVFLHAREWIEIESDDKVEDLIPRLSPCERVD